MAIVYCTTNLINGKKYIGSHKDDHPSYLGSGVYLTKAIKKYGKENFCREILWQGEECDRYRIEEETIASFMAADDKSFYNISHKGTGLPKGYKWSEEVLDKNREARKERLNKYRQSKIQDFIKTEKGQEHIKSLNKRINTDREIINKRNASLKKRYELFGHHSTGVPKPDTWKQKRKKQCIHCGIICDISNHTKWHGDKCKMKIFK